MAKILIADDDPAMLRFLSQALENSGHIITATENGKAAYDVLLSNTDFDMLLTDIVMPEMDGVELSKKAKELYPALKIMFITGFLASEAVNKPALDTSQVMTKPIHLQDLVRQIDELLVES